MRENVRSRLTMIGFVIFLKGKIQHIIVLYCGISLFKYTYFLNVATRGRLAGNDIISSKMK